MVEEVMKNTKRVETHLSDDHTDYGIDFNRLVVQKLDYLGQDWDLTQPATNYAHLESDVCVLEVSGFYGPEVRDQLLDEIHKKFRI